MEFSLTRAGPEAVNGPTIFALLVLAYVFAMAADKSHNLPYAVISGLIVGFVFGWLFGQQAIERREARKP